MNSVTTYHTLDLAAGLPQAPADNDRLYLYGDGRIAQYSAAATKCFLGDALVRCTDVQIGL